MKYILSFCVATLILAQGSERFSRENVKKILDSGEVRSVKSFLEFLSKSKHRVFLENYVLMFHSPSLQSASFESPRAIMFSREDEFVIAFNGDSSKKGGNQLEMMEFDREERAFKFFEVDFDKPLLQALSDFNPPKCLSCHRGPDPRPNWEPYFFWPGMYGGVDDELTVHIAYLTREYGKDFAQTIPPSERVVFRYLFESIEGKKYMEFNHSKKQHPRYSWLIDYKYPEEEEHLDMQNYDTGPNATRPGLQLTDMLHKLNKERILRKIEEAIQAAPSFAYAILGASYCRLPLSSSANFLPNHLQTGRRGLIDYINNQRRLIRENLERNIHRHTEATKDEISGKKDDTGNMGRLGRERPFFIVRPSLAQLEYVMELAGLNIDDWSMTFSGIPVSATNTFALPRSIVKNTVQELDGSEIVRPCPELAQKSLEALESMHRR